MKITKLSLQNFRQFYGIHEIEFIADDDLNITVIHGENGAGKTSLLNAFKWCFYGHTDFETAEANILNEHAVGTANAQEEISMWVQIEFQHDENKYIAKRTQKYSKFDSSLEVDKIGGAILELSWVDSYGAYRNSTNPDSHMTQILPEKMHSYFFFNGERIEKLAYASASQEIREAIKTLMGIEIVERGHKHLDQNVRRQLRKQIKKGASDELKAVIDKETKLDEELVQKKKEVEEIQNNVKEYKTDISIVSKRLKKIEEVAKYEQERISIKVRLGDIREELSDINAGIKSVIGTDGFLAFVQPAAQLASEKLVDSREKGELPYQIKQQFVEDLLERRECICGNTLELGSKQYAAVENYRHTAEKEGVEDAFFSTSVALNQVETSRSEMFSRIQTEINFRRRLKNEQDSLNGRLDDISKLIGQSEHEDATDLNNKLKSLEQKVENAIGMNFLLNKNLEDIQKDLADTRKEREELTQQSEKTELARHRLDIAEECARVLKQMHESLSRKTKEELSERVNKNFQKILKKDYWAEIDDEFCLQIYKDLPGHGQHIVYEKSTGESQITSLSFIGSIIELAKEKHKNDTKFFRGGVFPIVMDSPFGSLDPAYRTLTARYIPQLAEQIILFVSGTQWQGEVESECKFRVGKHVSLIYHAPTVGEGKESYYVRSGAEYEYTEIEEGHHG